MKLTTLIMLALGLAADAFAVSVSDGLSIKKLKKRHKLMIPLCFGAFQGIMPLIGCFAGGAFSGIIVRWDHWVAFGLLAFIGVRMTVEGLGGKEECAEHFTYKLLLAQGVATSIDALAVGVSFALMRVNAPFACAVIAAVTFLCSAAGVAAGKLCGKKLGARTKIAGGIILVIIGIKILAEHLIAG